MPTQNVTREAIHAGVSGTKTDAKWKDQLNFRSSDNKTVVVPKKFRLVESAGAGFHTLLKGPGSLLYAIGANESLVLRGQESPRVEKLWRVKVNQEGSVDRIHEPLKIRGAYQGTVPLKIRLTVVDGQIVTDADWPVENVEPEPVAPTISINCGKTRRMPVLTVVFVDSENGDAVMPGVEYTVFDGVRIMSKGVSNGNGAAVLQLPLNNYRIEAEYPGYNPVSEDIAFTADAQSEQIALSYVLPQTIGNRPPWPVVDLPYTGYMSLEFYDSGNPTVNFEVIHSFEVLNGEPAEFDFRPYYYAPLPTGFTADRWRLWETSGETVYYDFPIGQ